MQLKHQSGVAAVFFLFLRALPFKVGRNIQYHVFDRIWIIPLAGKREKEQLGKHASNRQEKATPS